MRGETPWHLEPQKLNCPSTLVLSWKPDAIEGSGKPLLSHTHTWAQTLFRTISTAWPEGSKKPITELVMGL